MSKRKGPIIFSETKPLAGLKKALQMGRVDVIEEIRSSNIKGRGGAGFPTGVKWNLAASAQSDEKFVVCNADEGEPGTFKDRVLLSEYASLMLEGMIIAGYAIGAKKGYVYLRGEYTDLLSALEETIGEMREKGVLGEKILGNDRFDFDIEIKRGSGAYVCGEETALIESMEGQRGEPRNRPPFPVNTGFLGRPTVVNNVETLVAVPHILEKGAEHFKSFGTHRSSGTKILSISGDCEKPGVYEVSYGTSVRELIEMAGAERTKAVQVGGASGECIKEDEFDRKIAFEDLSTGGSVIIFDKTRNMLDVVENFLKFFEEESCGQCTPCREGVPVLLEVLHLLKEEKCSEKYLKEMYSLSETLQLASKCGLGQSAPNAFVGVLDKFKEDYKVSGISREEKRFNG